jgi:iron(III) transport system substrate-binding protein
MGGRARVFIVNTRKLLPADYPSTLDDLLSPRWPAASVGIASPLFGTNATHAAALYAQRGAGSARTFYQAVQARGVRVVDGNSVVKDLVASGQLAWGLTDTDDVLEAMQRGAPVKAIAPDQGGAGTLVIPGTVALVAGAPHREQGQALVDFLLSANTEAALIRVGGCQTSLRIGAGPGHEKTGNATGLQGIKALAVGLNDVQAQLPTAMRDLREIFVR